MCEKTISINKTSVIYSIIVIQECFEGKDEDTDEENNKENSFEGKDKDTNEEKTKTLMRKRQRH